MSIGRLFWFPEDNKVKWGDELFCVKCGKKNVEGAIFCAFCGEKISVPDSVQREDASLNTYPETQSSEIQNSEIRNSGNPNSENENPEPIYIEPVTPNPVKTNPVTSNPVSLNPVPQNQVNPNPVNSYPTNPYTQPIVQPVQVIYRTMDNNQGYRHHKLSPNIPGIVFAALLLVSCCLPFAEVRNIESFAFVSIYPRIGIIVLLGAITAIVFSILNKRWGILGPGLGGIAGVIIQLLYWYNELSKYSGRRAEANDIISLFKAFVSFDIGFWGVIICSIALIICSFFESADYEYYDDGTETKTNDYLRKMRDEGNSNGSWTCFVCGAKNAMYIGTCKCGTNKSDPRNIVVAPVIRKITNSTAKCPSCGKVSSGDRMNCSNCGARLIK